MTIDAESREFDALLEYLRQTRGFDFSAYKRPSLIRRVQKRLIAVNLHRFEDYTDYLEVHPDEFVQLFDVLLINVTDFFRDETAWEFIRDQVIPPLAASEGNGGIRVWSAGCASGEEAYSVAMLLADAMGRERFRDCVKIYATDIDDQALNHARAAAYTEKQVARVPPPLVESYFVRDGDQYMFDKGLRRSVIFGRHDLYQDAPISRVNLLLCRNALMYFNSEAQGRILARFHFALTDEGVLFLGKAEMLAAHTQLFAPIDLRRRVFKKMTKDNWRDRMAIMNQANGEDLPEPAGNHDVLSATFDASPHAQFIVDGNSRLTLTNERSRALFNLTHTDVGRPLRDLEVSHRPVQLKGTVEKALEGGLPVMVRNVPWEDSDGGPKYFDVQVTPMNGGDGRPLAVTVSFVDVSQAQTLQAELNRSKQDLETAYEELQSTNEELETTNEELQSTVEELETTNEELQSTNEELETMNEELQSTNEELHTTNDELRERSSELNHAKGFLESVLTGVRSGVVVLDRELHVTAWNHRAEDLWGMRSDEVRGQNFLNLDIGLPIEQLRPSIRASLNNHHEVSEVAVAATNRRGKPILCKVTVTPLLGTDKENHGVILMMDEQPAATTH